jgi:autonomous glycyl radical cofactor GrcA
LLGYNEHHKWFGEKTKATPDGRFDGDMLKFGIGQSEGRDKNGLTALLNSIANLDPNGISCGSTVTNISIDEQLIKNDDNFEKTVDMLETYFKNGGIHFQLTYVSKEDLINAKETPENYGNLRVRVTGFSDYFVKLKENTFYEEDKILVWHIGYEPTRNDVVIIDGEGYYSNIPFVIKRIVATSGDSIAYGDGALIVNGKLVSYVTYE